LLGTVISRCQRYDFKNVPVEILKNHVLKIADAENIKFSSPIIGEKLAELGKGSVRDTLSIFDQVLGLSGSQNISEDSLTSALGMAGTSVIKELLSSILTSESKKCSKIYSQLIEENIDLKKLCDQILDGFYMIINSIDDQKTLYSKNVLHEKCLEGISIAEIFWIYESLVKDFQWALTSMNPEKVVLIMLQKVCLRRTILKGEDVKIEEIPQSGKSLAGATIKIDAPTKLAHSWDDFLKYLHTAAPATAANLGHGNLIEEFDIHVVPLTIHIAFPEDAAVFKEFLDDKEIYARLKNHLADFFEVDIEKLLFKTQLLTAEEKIDKKFKTTVEIGDESRKNKEEERRQKILNNPYVKEAEKLFNSKIDKIILND
jgi:DNA polymerase III gamma/tau subunit